MKNEERLNLFDQALSRLMAGENLDPVLKSMPSDADLIDMIRTASLIQMPVEQIQAAGQRAQQHNKQRFLQAALSLETSPNKAGFFGWLQGLRLVSRLALVAFVLVFSLTITGIGSAQALPGQPLYSVKRLVEQTQLALTRDSFGRLQLEEVLDARRVNEVLRLQKSERWQPVQFAGWMQQNPDGSWQVQGINILLDDQSPLWNPMLNGAYVEVNGLLSQAGVIVRQTELRLFKLHGTLQFVEADDWRVNGVPLRVSPQTQTQGLLTDGLLVDVTAIRFNSEQYLALVINVVSNKADQEATLMNNIPSPLSVSATEDVLASATVKSSTSIKTSVNSSSTDNTEDDQEIVSQTAGHSLESTDDDHDTVQKTEEPDAPEDTDLPDDD
jgi:hypothetical protein